MTAKVYVDVLAVFSREGELIPTAFVWEDGRSMRLIRFQNRSVVPAEKLAEPDIVIPVRWVEKSVI